MKFVIVDFRNDKEILGWIGLVVGKPFDLQKKGLVPSRGQRSMLSLAGAMIHPSYGTLKKPPFKFHHAREWNDLDIDHIHYAVMDGYLCFNIYKGWMKSKSQVCGSSKEVSAKRKRDKDEVEHVDEESEQGGSVVSHG